MCGDSCSLATKNTLWARWDASVTQFVLDGFDWCGWNTIRAPSTITKDWPFVQSPTMLITAIIIYLAVILVTLFWRSLRVDATKANGEKKTDPAWLRVFMLCHNIFLVALSTYMCIGTLYHARKQAYGYTIWGNMYRPEETRLAEMLYIFYLSKIYEFMDTFIMLLKGNVHQVSFLHVYHHISISFVWWFLVYSVPGGDTYYTCALNSFVHILMYTYYLLALIIGKDEKKRKKYLWWGKYMTLIQMGQFVFMTAQSVYCYFFTEFPKFLAAFLFLYMQTLLALFGNFFLRKHVFKTKQKRN